ncbi:hypothetical protein Bca52824_033630 [Brassica carinata]|uniref:Uncharacterized protein n=1 Tax=Brassica carinata TaxID=52824 RepID=A0A8X7V791_BRACI|nr:hypothetical protein Bca52824_033630 [Brassica carinata]
MPGVKEEEEKKVTDSDLNSFSDDLSPEVYKFSLTDMEEEKNKEERSMEDDYIDEAQDGEDDHRAFRFRERHGKFEVLYRSMEEEKNKEERSMEDDYIDEAQDGEDDHKAFRFRESSEERLLGSKSVNDEIVTRKSSKEKPSDDQIQETVAADKTHGRLAHSHLAPTARVLAPIHAIVS